MWLGLTFFCLSFAPTEGEVPGSAVLLFDIELLDLVSGLPEGYMFIWHDEVSPNLFEEIDKDNNKEVLLEEVMVCLVTFLIIIFFGRNKSVGTKVTHKILRLRAPMPCF